MPEDPDVFARLAYLALLLAGVTWFFFAGRRRPLGKTVRDVGLWVLIFAMVILAYGFRDVIERELFPGRAMTVTEGTIELRRGPDGHFDADITVNGTSIRFTIDTGATDIVLTREDAQAVGLDPDNLDFSGRARTANGVVETAPVRLDTLTFGPFTDEDVRASVNGGELGRSLLGMAYLDRFARIELAGERMVLHR